MPIWAGTVGALQTKLNTDNAGKIIDYFYDSCKAFRTNKTLYIDLDSYWDNMTSVVLMENFQDAGLSETL